MNNLLWEEIQGILKDSQNNIEFKEIAKNDLILSKLDVNKDSVLGQVIINTSGISVNKYIRIYANGNEINNRNIVTFNSKLEKYFGEDKLFVADDIWGGLFAINKGFFEENMGDIWYFAPDTLDWDNIEISYPEFIAWVSSKNVDEFYSGFKWKNFERDIANIRFDQGMLIYPFLWSKECDIENATKRIVPFEELLSLNFEYKIL